MGRSKREGEAGSLEAVEEGMAGERGRVGVGALRSVGMWGVCVLARSRGGRLAVQVEGERAGESGACSGKA